MEVNWDYLTQASVALFTGLGVAYATIRSRLKSDGKPPPERPISVHETREALVLLKDQVTKNREVVTDEMRRVLAAIDRLDHSLRQLESSLRAPK